MRHPYENYQRAQLGTILLALVLAVVAIFQLEHQWIILLMFYVLAGSLVFDALIELKKQQRIYAIIQLLRAIIIFLFTTILFF
ncbi:hypothetical protein [Halobacillus salinus]|uniref:DUF4181 domain-containing protein n=1 Tax=Halobacillus salinus TaxID=192814 RepID=A0A4Z0GZ21_9BACI|nr:hypothetical protein [Halobacillus salinus]TGB02645.1 hypothetical protein E4663_10810 [Halobacillus salinus]